MEEIKKTSLGEISKKRNIPKSMLHYYAKVGLIVPTDVVGNMQLYNEDELEKKLKLIERYKNQKLSLKQIKEIFNKEIV